MKYKLFPKYGRAWRPYTPNFRYVLLAELRARTLRRRKLEELLMRIFPVLRPRPKRIPYSEGFTQTTMKLEKPALPKKRFYQLLYELRRDGLADATHEHGDQFFRITARGRIWLEKFKKKPQRSIIKYPNVETSDRITIISYDIPEKMKLYRNWLRAVLRRIKFRSIQKSVWVGKVKLPADFIADLTRYKLETYIEIFEITKAGTLRHRL